LSTTRWRGYLRDAIHAEHVPDGAQAQRDVARQLGVPSVALVVADRKIEATTMTVA
jgi:hypothetical protein